LYGRIGFVSIGATIALFMALTPAPAYVKTATVAYAIGLF
jgi:hypothetical protein